MVQVVQKLTFEEYASLDAEAWAKLGLPEGRCEYVDEWKLHEWDYIDKPQQYADRDIPEYWRIDPSRSVVTVLRFVDGSYQETNFTGGDPILFPTFPDLQLTADQILNPGQ